MDFPGSVHPNVIKINVKQKITAGSQLVGETSEKIEEVNYH